MKSGTVCGVGGEDRDWKRKVLEGPLDGVTRGRSRLILATGSVASSWLAGCRCEIPEKYLEILSTFIISYLE